MYVCMNAQIIHFKSIVTSIFKMSIQHSNYSDHLKPTLPFCQVRCINVKGIVCNMLRGIVRGTEGKRTLMKGLCPLLLKPIMSVLFPDISFEINSEDHIVGELAHSLLSMQQ